MNDNLLLNIIRGFVSFVLAMVLTVSTVAFWAQATLLNYNNVDNYIEDKFYDMLYSEVCENILENTVSTGLPEEVLTAPLTKDIIALEMNSSLKSLYDGEKYALKTATLESDYKNTIFAYAQENGLELDEQSTDELVRYIIRLVENSVRIPFANTLSPYFSLIKEYIGYVAYGTLATALLISLFLFFLCRPRTVIFRYIGRSLMVSGVLGAFVSLYVTTKNLTSSVNIASPAYSEAIMNISQKSFNSLLVISIVFFAIGLIFSLIPCKESGESTDSSSCDASDRVSDETDDASKDTCSKNI